MLNPNVPAWFEIPTDDLDRAQRFYESVLDLSLRRENFGGTHIAVFPYGGKPHASGALVAMDDCLPSVQGSIVYLSVDNLASGARPRPTTRRRHARPAHRTAGRHGFLCAVPRLRRQSRRSVVAGMSALPLLSVTGAAFAALVRSQIPAAAATALFRDHDVIVDTTRRSEFVATIYWLDRRRRGFRRFLRTENRSCVAQGRREADRVFADRKRSR